MKDLTEFNKLEELLKGEGIEYEREDSEEAVIANDHFFWHQLRSPDNAIYGEKWKWDVIYGRCSYGQEVGALEMWGENMDEPEGYMTAEACLRKIKEILGK